jgi:hypothetical protein
MRRISMKWVAAAVVVLMLAIPMWAEDVPTPPVDAPQWRVQPPVGVRSEWRVQPPGGLLALMKLWLQSRLSIPNG